MADPEAPAELGETKAGGSEAVAAAVETSGDGGVASNGGGALVTGVGSGEFAASASGAGGFSGDDEEREGRDEDGDGDGEDPHEQELVGIASNEVKNIILQVLSPYFEDDGTEGGEDEDTAQRYDHIKCKSWIQLICDGILERLLALGKPYKYVAHCMIMRKCGAGMHVCSSCYYGAADGWVSHAHDLSAHIYAVVTVYWLAI